MEAEATGSTRAAQRRRTRKAIVEATTRLLQTGATPSMTQIASAADVSRRTVYGYFPNIDQLLLDATLGALASPRVDRVLVESDADDPRARVQNLITALSAIAADSMHLGRTLIRLTVDADGTATDQPRRGYRRVEWIETALQPLRAQLSGDEFDRLVSALVMIIGWEGRIVLRDIRGLDREAEVEVTGWAARALIDAALHQAG